MSSVVRPAHAVGVVATAAIAFAVGVETIEAVMAWALVSAQVDEVTYWVSLLVHVVAGIAFVVWMNQARFNADTITSKHQARWTNMWVFVGWIIPVANLFIPYAVMQDVWRGSDRTQPMVGLRQRPLSGLVRAWWLCWIGSNVLATVSWRSAPQDVALLITISTSLSIAAAVLVARMIRVVNEMQVSVPSAYPAPAA
ncbi:DUF4328 domain-containing protein [Lentzea sp. NBRC 102530]|uniref:DUF4328 domain-containing protein n=1 Tax=Lentzea sp. NBRC 102530 TaxID=3032201 RepID=UPI0024A42F92|nr:DUF4328 domain-containing protein [Lentzea sp. NBRC 102530]GLY49635.1 hypothetical protein Lesp01_32910 [Lentzea sp. NBRC 102530]